MSQSGLQDPDLENFGAFFLAALKMNFLNFKNELSKLAKIHVDYFSRSNFDLSR